MTEIFRDQEQEIKTTVDFIYELGGRAAVKRYMIIKKIPEAAVIGGGDVTGLTMKEFYFVLTGKFPND